MKRTSPEVKCLHPTSSRREMCTSSVSNVIYHKFSHGAAFHTLNVKNVNVMLEFCMKHRERNLIRQAGNSDKSELNLNGIQMTSGLSPCALSKHLR